MRKGIWVVGALVVAAVLAILAFEQRTSRPSAAQPKATRPDAIRTAIGCLGRIEPEGGTIKVAAPSSAGRAIITRLYVKQGDEARAGEVLAVLDSRRELLEATRQAALRETAARDRLAQLTAPPKSSELAAQQAEVQRVQKQRTNAENEYHRYAGLLKTGDVSASEVDDKRLQVEILGQSLIQAEERLKSISEIRPADVAVAQTDVTIAQAERSRARLNYSQAYVHAPATGIVLNIFARPGEEVGPNGILEIAPTDRMNVEAEVDEADLRRVSEGQTAIISSAALPVKLQGVVDKIGTEISQSKVLPPNPAADIDRRTGKVIIRLNDIRTAKNFIHLQVDVLIQQ